MVWLPDGSALTVLDKQGNAALLDIQGAPHSWHLAGSGVGISGEHKVLPYKLWGAKFASQQSRYHLYCMGVLPELQRSCCRDLLHDFVSG